MKKKEIKTMREKSEKQLVKLIYDKKIEIEKVIISENEQKDKNMIRKYFIILRSPGRLAP